MTRENKLAILKNRFAVLQSNGKNIESSGVVRKLRRQIRTIENEV